MSQTERQSRMDEELRSLEDYYNEILSVYELCSNTTDKGAIGKDLDKIVELLVKGLMQKYKYLVRKSNKWRKKQGLFSRIRDVLSEKKEAKRLKKQLEREQVLEQISRMRERAKQAPVSGNKDSVTSSSTALVVAEGEAQSEAGEDKDSEQLSLLAF